MAKFRTGKYWLAGGLVLVLAGGICLLGAERFFGPVLLSIPKLPQTPVIQDGKFQRWQDCYAFERGGILAAYLTGPAEIRGAAQALFFSRQLAQIENSMVVTVRRFIPSQAIRWVLARVVIIRNRSLPQYLSLDMQKELAGIAASSKDLYPQYGSHYVRLLNYLAAHDISHVLMDTNLMACTAFGVTSSLTKTRTPLLGRNFDFEAGPAFDQYKAVFLIQPETGHAFLSIAWPGMPGVVSGMNDAGIAVVLLAGHAQGRRGIGSPITAVAREVLVHASTLAEAIAFIRQSQIFVAESLLLGSGQEDRFVVVEKTPQRMAVREMAEGKILAANHFLAPEFASDPQNQGAQKQGSSLARYQRLACLLKEKAGQLDVFQSVAILRDRNDQQGQPLGLGNRAAINSLIASHSVVFDLKRKIVWVSASPHQLGPFLPFAFESFAQTPQVEPIAADPLLSQGGYGHYLRYQKEYLQAEKLFQKKQYQASYTRLLEIRPFNPRDYQNFRLAGKALMRMGQKAEARAAWQTALQLEPAFWQEKQEIEKDLQSLNEK